MRLRHTLAPLNLLMHLIVEQAAFSAAAREYVAERNQYT